MVMWISVWDMVMNQWKTGSHFSLTETWLNFHHRTPRGAIPLSSFPWQWGFIISTSLSSPELPLVLQLLFFSLYPPVMFVVNQLCFSLCSSSVSPQLSGFPAPKPDLIRPQKANASWNGIVEALCLWAGMPPKRRYTHVSTLGVLSEEIT